MLAVPVATKIRWSGVIKARHHISEFEIYWSRGSACAYRKVFNQSVTFIYSLTLLVKTAFIRICREFVMQFFWYMSDQLNVNCIVDFFSSTRYISYLFLKLIEGSVDRKNQLDVTFCIFYFSSNSCSTCFGQPCAHHQELTTAWCYSLVLVCATAHTNTRL